MRGEATLPCLQDDGTWTREPNPLNYKESEDWSFIQDEVLFSHGFYSYKGNKPSDRISVYVRGSYPRIYVVFNLEPVDPYPAVLSEDILAWDTPGLLRLLRDFAVIELREHLTVAAEVLATEIADVAQAVTP